jgi:hypothetical protein
MGKKQYMTFISDIITELFTYLPTCPEVRMWAKKLIQGISQMRVRA